MKKRVLFIDDEAMVLQSLKRVLHSMSNEWDMEFVDSGAKALALMAEKPFDIVISDMLMPGMSGAQLLEEVMRLYPATVRFILSGHAPGNEVFKSITSSDHFFAKPINVNALTDAVRRVSATETSLVELHQSIKAQTTGESHPDKIDGVLKTEEVTRIVRSIENSSASEKG